MLSRSVTGLLYVLLNSNGEIPTILGTTVLNYLPDIESIGTDGLFRFVVGLLYVLLNLNVEI